MSVLRNVEVQWAQVLTPDTRFEHMWSITAILKPEHKEQLLKDSKAVDPKGKGVKFKEDDNGNLTFRFKRKVNKADGSGQNNPPLVCGPSGKNEVFTQLIGNGSVCNIQYRMVPYDNKFGKGVVCDLQGVQVIQHVPYGVQDGDEFGSEDNGSAPATNSSNEYDDGDFS